MYIITLQDEPSGIYSVFNDSEDRIIPLFEQEDDALRYLFLLEETNSNPDLEILEVEPDLIITACRSQGQKYSIITADDLIIPPPDKK
jgi:hypothetical protein|tara:strand:- start:5304 stop:5567 length:264 start_codon:yes stop_codon:yes gene_type:complete